MLKNHDFILATCKQHIQIACASTTEFNAALWSISEKFSDLYIREAKQNRLKRKSSKKEQVNQINICDAQREVCIYSTLCTCDDNDYNPLVSH